MNIALIGAPSSGKTSLAYRLSSSLEVYDPSCGCGERKVKIIDYYAAEVEREYQVALGPIADYIGNLYVALERYLRERVARADHDIVITCGTVIETAVYLAMQFVSMTNVMNAETKLEQAPKIDALLRTFAVLYSDIFKYDHAFYLPPKGGNEEIAFIDQQLQAGLEGFKLIPVTPLIDADTQLEDALAAMTKPTKAEPERA